MKAQVAQDVLAEALNPVLGTDQLIQQSLNIHKPILALRKDTTEAVHGCTVSTYRL